MRGPTRTEPHTHTHTEGDRSHHPSHPPHPSLSTFLSQTQGSCSPGQTSFPVLRGRQGEKEFTVRNQQETMGEGNLEAIRGKFEAD